NASPSPCRPCPRQHSNRVRRTRRAQTPPPPVPPPRRPPPEHGRAAMRSFWMNLRYWLGDYRVLAALALLGAAAVAYFGRDGLLAAGGWLLAALVAGALAWLLVL